jgi:hypothetical protein
MEIPQRASQKEPQARYARLGLFAVYYFNIRLLSWTATGLGG